MTDRAEALRALIEKVEAGECPDPKSLIWIDACRRLNGATAWMAFNGSLDAAKSMHEAVLPGWDVQVGTYEDDAFEASVANPLKVKTYDGVSTYMARAWLLAILRALLSMEGGE